MMETLINIVFLNISGHFEDPNDDYLQMEILAPDRGIVSPVRFWYPQYDFPNRGSSPFPEAGRAENAPGEVRLGSQNGPWK